MALELTKEEYIRLELVKALIAAKPSNSPTAIVAEAIPLSEYITGSTKDGGSQNNAT